MDNLEHPCPGLVTNKDTRVVYQQSLFNRNSTALPSRDTQDMPTGGALNVTVQSGYDRVIYFTYALYESVRLPLDVSVCFRSPNMAYLIRMVTVPTYSRFALGGPT